MTFWLSTTGHPPVVVSYRVVDKFRFASVMSGSAHATWSRTSSRVTGRHY